MINFSGHHYGTVVSKLNILKHDFPSTINQSRLSSDDGEF